MTISALPECLLQGGKLEIKMQSVLAASKLWWLQNFVWRFVVAYGLQFIFRFNDQNMITICL